MHIVFEAAQNRSAAYDSDKCVGFAALEERDGRWVITHTEVDPAYGGQGIARGLIEEVIAAARRDGKKITPFCSYADKMLTGNAAYRDVLAD